MIFRTFPHFAFRFCDPLEIITTTANVHDVRGGEKPVASLLNGWNDITLIKADLGYRGMFKECPLSEMDVTLYCVKSNFGTAEFRPIHGRWVVERTFSWLQNYRRMMRNYEQHLLTARAMALLASVFFHAPLFRLTGIFDGMAVLSGQNPALPSCP